MALRRVLSQYAYHLWVIMGLLNTVHIYVGDCKFSSQFKRPKGNPFGATTLAQFFFTQVHWIFIF